MPDDQPKMLVVLDSATTSPAPLQIAQRYASETLVLSGWSAEPPDTHAEIKASQSAEPTVSEALGLAAERGISWVGMRRSFQPPGQLLSELLLATAEHTDEAIPGFAVFLADGEPKAFKHVLAIFDRSNGPMSGLLAFASVAVADIYDAQLDILVIGETDKTPRTEDTFSALAISREQELYQAAVDRAREHNVRVNWITATPASDMWPIIADQLSQHDYDLVVDDLGDVSLAKTRQRGTIEAAMAKGAAGEIPRHLLTDTSLPVLLVIDEIRLQWAPERVLKAGAIAAVTLGVMGTPVAMAAAAPVPAAVAVEAKRDPAKELVSELEEALGIADEDADDAEEEAKEERAAAASDASRGASSGAREAAEGAVAVASAEPASTQYSVDGESGAALPGVSVSAASVVPITLPATDVSSDKDSKAEKKAKAKAKKKRAAAAKETSRSSGSVKKVSAPKGGASPRQVAKAVHAAAKDRAAVAKDKSQAAKSKQEVADLKDEIADVEQAGHVAHADLEAAVASFDEAKGHADQVQSSASSMKAVLPGLGPSDDEVEMAVDAAEAAADRLDEAVDTGEEVLTDLEKANKSLAKEKKDLKEARSDVKASQVDYTQSAKKAEVYRASMAAQKQTPVAKGKYNITARFGAGGSYWSSGSHTGLDFAAPSGTPVTAAASGTVVSTGWAGAYGNRVVVRHGNGLKTTYNHMSSIAVKPGQKVSTGQRVGRVGSTGNSTGAHLHFEVEKNGTLVNPATWLGL